MSHYHLLRVFCSEDGSEGNPLAVFAEGNEVATESRLFTPAVELDFAGHPAVGTAWLLAHQGSPVDLLRPPAGEVGVRYANGASFVTARPEWAPPFEWDEFPSAAEIDALDGPPRGHDLIGAWAWIDEEAGSVRTRVFPQRLGVAEDEATGAASLRLAAQLGRKIDIRQGRGSRILARPLEDGYAEIGGRTVLDEPGKLSTS